MPIGNVNKDSAPKRETFRPPWVKDKGEESPPSWMQKKLKPVDSSSKSIPAGQEDFTIKPIKRKWFFLPTHFIYFNTLEHTV